MKCIQRVSHSKKYVRLFSLGPFNNLPFTVDKFNGIVVNCHQLPSDAARFSEVLKSDLQTWKKEDRTSVWLKIPSNLASFIVPAVSEGFEFHHSEKDYVAMTKWLAPGENKIPIAASHQVGVGCVVLNKKNELLLVQEKTGLTKGMNLWKFPTGLLDIGEDIPDGAVREVMEETGVATKFRSVLGFRQTHNVLFGKSGLYFVCFMDLLNEDETKITMQESELDACEWRDANSWYNQSFYQKSEVHSKFNSIVMKEIQHRINNNYSISNAGSGNPTIVLSKLQANTDIEKRGANKKDGMTSVYFAE